MCSRNQWRSPTAEKVWRDRFGFRTRSCGTSSKARKTISASDLKWADLVFVMEQKHKNRIQASFKQLVQYKEIVVLDIPDNYQYLDPELVIIFESIAQQYIHHL